jgi:hypothetical protein
MNATGSNGGTQIYYDDWASGQPVAVVYGTCNLHKNEAKDTRPASLEA